MKKFVLLVFLLYPVVVSSAEIEPPPAQTEEPKLYDHFVGIQQTQERLSQRPPE